jgi:hypothetical protein
MTDENNSNSGDGNNNKKNIAQPMSFTISGTQGGKAKLSIQDEQGTIESELVFEPPAKKEEVNLDRMDINHEEKMLGVNVLLRINEEGPTPEGIDGGRITRMTLTEGEKGDERILAHFDKGKWIEPAETPLEIQVKMRAMKQENGLAMPEVTPAFDQTHKNKLKP